MTGRLRIGIAAAAALALTCFGLMRVLAPSTWIWSVFGAIVVSAASGELARRLIRLRPVVVLVQVFAVLWYDTVVLAHDKAALGLFPGPGVFKEFGQLFHQGANDLQGTVPGGPATPGITAILVLSIGAVAILVDALAATYAMAPLVGLPLLALYLVPATRVGGGYDWLAFTLTAVGYTALLSSEGRERLGRWGRPLVHAGMRRGEGGVETGAPARPARVDTGPIAATGHQITMIALVAAVIAPVFIPTISSGLFGLGPNGGNGSQGSGNGPVSISQAVDFKGSLTHPAVNVLTYTTSDNDPVYLRLEADDNYDGVSWTTGPNVANTQVTPDGTITDTVPGLDPNSGVQVPRVRANINYLGTVSENADTSQHDYTLPAPYPELSLNAPAKGPTWSFNAQTYALTGPSSIPKNYSYSVGFSRVDGSLSPFPRSLLDASPAMTRHQGDQLGVGIDMAMPAGGIPGTVDQAAHAAVKGQTSPFEQAVALTNYFNRNFTYSTDVPAPQNGNDAMVYLLTSKKGYCQYFAWTMAAMARDLGIPARVAVGFAQGTEKDGTYTVTTRDLHAWPELYFQNIGWLRFEPTPGMGTFVHSSTPGYATAAAATTPTPTATATASAGPAATNTAANCSEAQRKAGACPSDGANSSAHSKQAFGYLGWFGAVPRFLDYWLLGGSPGAIVLRFVLLALLLLASVPMLLRVLRRRRRGRIAGGRIGRRSTPDTSAENLEWEAEEGAVSRPKEQDGERVRVLAAWAEIRDTATDLGYAWPPAETPRQNAQRIVKQARFSRSAIDAMDRMAGLTERANYAPTFRSAEKSLFEDVRTIRSSLAEPVSRRTRLRATMLPQSSLTAIRERREDLTGRMYERVQKTGARIRRTARRR